jgi:hypothetical protein
MNYILQKGIVTISLILFFQNGYEVNACCDVLLPISNFSAAQVNILSNCYRYNKC